MKAIARNALMALSVAAVAAGTGQASAADESKEIVDLVTWDHAALYEGWSAERLIDTEVVDANGEAVGEVHNLVVGPEGQMKFLIVEAGGILNIGDSHYAVPWDKAKVAKDLSSVTVPVTEDNLDQYSLFEDVRTDRPEGEPRPWRATELIDDYVSLEDRPDYGYVEDLIFTREGELNAVVVRPDVRYRGRPGSYAYPYYGYRYGWRPGFDYYALPYGEAEISDLLPSTASG